VRPSSSEYRTVEVEPVTARIGAVMRGLDLRAPLTEEARADLHDAITRHLVLFFRDQDLSDDEHLAFASTFGTVNHSAYAPAGATGAAACLEWIEDGPDSPPKADLWHTDVAFLDAPPDFAVLNLRVAPPVGGDTLWADLYGAYDALSSAMQAAIEPLELDLRPGTPFELSSGTRRWFEYARDHARPQSRHPLVRVHPVTGRRVLFLAGQFIEGITGMSSRESDVLLGLLRQTISDPNLQCRWHWREHDVVIWDERCTNHRATSSHYPTRRIVRRCTVGSRPLGPEAVVAVTA
jgi:taurine dioxygenase